MLELDTPEHSFLLTVLRLHSLTPPHAPDGVRRGSGDIREGRAKGDRDGATSAGRVLQKSCCSASGLQVISRQSRRLEVPAAWAGRGVSWLSRVAGYAGRHLSMSCARARPEPARWAATASDERPAGVAPPSPRQRWAVRSGASDLGFPSVH